MKKFSLRYFNRYNILLLTLLFFISTAFGAGTGFLMAQRGISKNPLQPSPIPTPSPIAQTVPPTQPAQFTTNSPVVKIAKQVGPTVVGIVALKGKRYIGDGGIQQGSGVIIDGRKGYIVTNNHVIAGAEKIIVTIDKNRNYPATIVGADEGSDLAVLQVKSDNLPQASLGDSSKVQVGETVAAIGNPLGREFARSVTVGVISALNREVSVPGPQGSTITLETLQTDAPINPGNSGGALVNLQGEVIGINSVKIATTGVEGMGFAIPINDARPIINQLITNGYVNRPFIGIYNIREITSDMSEWYNIPTGVYIGGVFENGPADKAGVNVGDIIIKANNRTVTNFNELQDIISSMSPGDKVTLTIVRDKSSNPLNITVTLGKLPK
ncbi:MAG: serine protease Do [Clostridia bacterium]|nr:serine protease Do [Clostridia bacterium]